MHILNKIETMKFIEQQRDTRNIVEIYNGTYPFCPRMLKV